jgi:hypothetical protein
LQESIVRLFQTVVLSVLFLSALALAQSGSSNDQLRTTYVSVSDPDKESHAQKQDGEMPEMPSIGIGNMQSMGMDSSSPMSMQSQTFLEEIEHHATSGTSAEPNSTPTPMWMTVKGPWTIMFHANVFVTDEQQSSSRGGDKFFSTNWFMPMAQRKLASGILTLRTMLSLEPATVTDRRYPLLFQQGETAFGVSIADGQHPHNFFMEIAALYDWKLGESALLSFYAAPVGDPALGPIAYPHRASALENPVGALGHHQEDSTHIADDVLTVGLTYRIARIEASGFHGREPDENRWTIMQGGIDSWSTRMTVQPGQNWSGQYSYGRLHSLEALFPNEDQERMTASIMYNRPFQNGDWANTFLWGRTRSLQENSIFDSYLFESNIRFLKKNYAWTRIERVERSNELIIGENRLPPGFTERPIGQVQAYTLGYERDFHILPHIDSAIGGQFTTYSVPGTLTAFYGSHPVGVTVFLRLRPISGQHK